MYHFSFITEIKSWIVHKTKKNKKILSKNCYIKTQSLLSFHKMKKRNLFCRNILFILTSNEKQIKWQHCLYTTSLPDIITVKVLYKPTVKKEHSCKYFILVFSNKKNQQKKYYFTLFVSGKVELTDVCWNIFTYRFDCIHFLFKKRF